MDQRRGVLDRSGQNGTEARACRLDPPGPMRPLAATRLRTLDRVSRYPTGSGSPVVCFYSLQETKLTSIFGSLTDSSSKNLHHCVNPRFSNSPFTDAAFDRCLLQRELYCSPCSAWDMPDAAGGAAAATASLITAINGGGPQDPATFISLLPASDTSTATLSKVQPTGILKQLPIKMPQRRSHHL